MNNRSHVDERSGEQINPKVVIAMVVPSRVHPTAFIPSTTHTAAAQPKYFKMATSYLHAGKRQTEAR
jgi:hypothetical protein